MFARCELTAKARWWATGQPLHIKTKRRFLPNLCNVTFIFRRARTDVRLRVSTTRSRASTRGGLDAFLIKGQGGCLSPRAATEAGDREEGGQARAG